MTKNKCNNCSYELKDDWNFCPRCGAEIPKWYDKLNYGLDRMLLQIAEDLKNLLFSGIVEVSFNKNQQSKSNYSNVVSNIQTHNKKMEEIQKSWEIQEVKEPAVKYKDEGDKTEVEIITPPIEKESNALLTIQKESVEVKVYDQTNKTLYFKVISIPPRTRIINKKIENQMLKIIFVKDGDDNYIHRLG